MTSGAVYAAGALFLYSRFAGATVISTRALGELFAVAVICSCIVALASVGIYALGGVIAGSDYIAASLRFWVGDLIGIAIVTPFLLVLVTRERFARPGLESIVQMMVVLTLMAFIFSAPPARQFQLFYLLFLPVVWIAVRSGFEAITAALVVIQIALILLLKVRGASAVDVTSIQACLLVLAFTGLTAGMLVTERQRAVNQQRLQQDVQARLQQLGTMGELTTMLAHELNQPLMAAGTYTRVAAEAIETLPGSEKPLTAVRKAAQQVERAAEVVRRLRGLVRLGRSEREYIQVHDVVTACLDLLAPDLEARPHVRITNAVEPEIPEVLADRVQVEQVLLNLLRNSLEALAETRQETGQIVLRSAIEAEANAIRLEVWDDGPGFASDVVADIAPFRSTKSGGLGIGLALSRTLVEAHGGKLEILPTTKGACVAFTLPIG
jgi:signal transduction histidine kinase